MSGYERNSGEEGLPDEIAEENDASQRRASGMVCRRDSGSNPVGVAKLLQILDAFRLGQVRTQVAVALLVFGPTLIRSQPTRAWYRARSGGAPNRYEVQVD